MVDAFASLFSNMARRALTCYVEWNVYAYVYLYWYAYARSYLYGYVYEYVYLNLFGYLGFILICRYTCNYCNLVLRLLRWLALLLVLLILIHVHYTATDS